MAKQIKILQSLEPATAARLMEAVAESAYSDTGKQQIVCAIDALLISPTKACTPPSAKKGRIGEPGSRIWKDTT